MPPIYKSKVFWTLVAGILAFVVKFFYPAFPFSEIEILAAIYFVLNSFEIFPELRARGLMNDG